MGLKSRIEKLESRQKRVTEIENESSCRQRCELDANGRVVACEAIRFKLVPGLDTLGSTAVSSEPFKRETCVYSECEYLDSCAANGSPVAWARAA